MDDRFLVFKAESRQFVRSALDARLGARFRVVAGLDDQRVAWPVQTLAELGLRERDRGVGLVHTAQHDAVTAAGHGLVLDAVVEDHRVFGNSGEPFGLGFGVEGEDFLD
ncbi:hypothetical protein [Rhizobium laguerreae]|uniref:hypothetical protein n=1 Tax=Rhizobium laguerreae TaxID=1076926 RepID=UPI001C910AE5|nr:hypothetical protein [Rhizobium laguerreae]MBY3048740.1 hypothetical protein [Rhizobium laguerreae]